MRRVQSNEDADRSISRLHILDQLGEVGLPGSVDGQQRLERVVHA